MARQDQLDMKMMAEAELARLQRQYRIMEGDRKAFFDEIRNKIAKQKRIIAGLRKERNQLLDDIRVATCEGQKKKDSKISASFEILLQKYDGIVEEIENEKRRLDEIEEQIKKTERQVSAIRLKEITDNEYQDRIKSGQKSIQMLENKLETTIKRFCGVLTENKQLREEIDHLLKERTRFNTIWEKLLQDLNSGKKFMLELIEQATLAYDQREEWCSKLQALKIRAHNDVINHTQEMREMQRQLDHDCKLKEFLTIKGQRRVMKDLEQKELQKQEEEKHAKDKQLSKYKKTLEKIQEFCDEDDVEKIAAKYVKQEEENFALFNYVNELNHELDTLNSDTKDVQEKIKIQKEIFEEKSKMQINTLESLNRDFEKHKEIADGDEAILNETQRNLQQVLHKINEIFNILVVGDTSESPILDLLGDNPEINEDNVMIYLGLVEKKISTLVTKVYFKEKSLLRSKKVRG